MRSRKRARLKRQRIATARKAVAAFMVIVLTVGLMPNWSAWGEANSAEPVVSDKMLKASSADADDAKASKADKTDKDDKADKAEKDEKADDATPAAEPKESAEAEEPKDSGESKEPDSVPDAGNDAPAPAADPEPAKEDTAPSSEANNASVEEPAAPAADSDNAADGDDGAAYAGNESAAADDEPSAPLGSLDEAIEQSNENTGNETVDEPQADAIDEEDGEDSAVLTTQSSYYINMTTGGYPSGNWQGAANGDTIPVTIKRTTGAFHYVYEFAGANKDKTTKYTSPRQKNETSNYNYTVPTGYYVSKVTGNGSNQVHIYVLRLDEVKVTLDYNGGKQSNKSSTTVTFYKGYSGIIRINTSTSKPTRAGYDFTGWNTLANGRGTHYDNGATATFNGDQTLYAEWTRTASFVPGEYGTSNVSSATFYCDSAGTGYLNRTATTSQSVTLQGVGDWRPAGWATSRTKQTLDQNANFTLTANTLGSASTKFYSILNREVSLTYDANGADAATSEVPKAQTFTQVNYGGNYRTTTCSVTLADEPTNLERAGYEFEGWEIDGKVYQPGHTHRWTSADDTANVTAKAYWVVSTLVENKTKVSLDDWTYGDTPKTPNVTATYGADKAEISYSTNKTGPYSPTVPTDAGTYYVRAVIAKDKPAGYLKGEATDRFTIKPREVEIEWSNTEFDYDGNSHEPTATVKNLVGSDTCTVTVSGAETKGGTHTARASAAVNSNYKLPTGGASTKFTIKPIPLKVTANAHTITYGDALSGNGATYQGLIEADKEADGTPKRSAVGGTLGYNYSYSRYGDVGTYTGAITPKGLSSSSYAIEYVAGDLTVEPREVTLTWSTPNSFTYTGNSISWPEPKVGNLVHNDDVTAVWATGSGSAVATATTVGDYKPSVEKLAGTKAKNYKLPTSGLEGEWHITIPPTNKMTVTIAGWTYGKSPNKPKVTADFGANTATFAYYTDENCTTLVTGPTESDGRPKNAGNYWVKATIPAVAGAYPEASATCPFTISKAQITVSATDLQSKLNEAKKTLTYTVAPANGLAAGDSLNGIVEVKEDPSNQIVTSKTGSYNIKMDWASGKSANDLPNYDVHFEDGTYTVVRGDATVSASGYTGTYDGVPDDEHITVTASDSNVQIYYSDTVDFSTLLSSSDYNALLTEETTTSDAFISAWNKLQTALSAANYKTNAADYTYTNAGTYKVYFLAVGKDVKTDVIVGYKEVVINKAPLTVTANDKSIQYGEDPANDGVKYEGFVNGENESALTGTLSYAYGGYKKDDAPGRYSITPSGLSAANYAITYVNGTLTVGPKELGLEWDTPDSFVYKGSDYTYDKAKLTGVPSGADVKPVVGGTTKATNVGTYTAMVTGLSGANASNYTLASSADTTHDWTITQAELVVTANDNEITYGDVPAANGVKFEPAAGSGSVTGSVSYTFDYNQYDAVGESYKITPDGLSSSNYNITYKYGTLKVKPRELTLTWPTPDALAYTGDELTYGEPTLGNIVNGDDVSIDVYSGSKGTEGGPYKAKVESIKGEQAGNYTLPSETTHDWTINGATNTVTVNIESWTYGDDPKIPTATDAQNVNTYEYEYSDSSTGPWSSAVPTDAGSYWVRATVPESGYYAKSDAVAPFEIYQREIGLKWTNLAFVYDATQHVPTATATGLINGDTCKVTVGGAKTEGGLYTATAKKLDNDNYKLPSNVNQLFVIAPVALKITANDNTITYGDAPSGNGVTYEGLLDADKNDDGTPKAGVLSGSLQYTYDYEQFNDVGDYKVTPAGLSSTSYAIEYLSGKLTVDPREVTFVWSTPDTFGYTGSDITWPEPTVGNLVNSDDVTAVWAEPTGATDVYKAKEQGEYKPVAGSLAGAKATNYKLPDDVAAKTGSWKIDKPAANKMTVAMSDWTYGKYSKAANGPSVTADYGASTATFTYYTDEDCNNVVAATDMDTTNNVPKNVGTYWVKADIADTASYPAASAKCEFKISKAKITVTADDKVAVRGPSATIVPLTFSVSGDLASWDSPASTSLDGIVEAASDDAPNDIKPTTAGAYTIKMKWVSGKDADSLPNYDVEFIDGAYTVTRAIASVSSKGYTGTYDGVADTEHIDDVSVTSGSSSGDAGGIAFSGAVKIYYSETNFKELLNLSSTDLTALQGADVSDSAFKTAWENLNSALASNSGKYSDKPESFTYKNVKTYPVYFLVVSDQVSPDVVFGSENVVINKAPLTVTAGNKSIPMGAAAADDGYTITGFVNNEDESGLRAVAPEAELTGTVTYSFGSYDQGSPVMGNYPITPTGLSAANYDIAFVPGTLTVTAIPLTLKWSENDSFVYSGNAQTYDTPTLVGVPDGQDVKVVPTTSTFTATDGGTYTATVTGLTGDDAAKYTLSGAATSHQWKITPAQLTVTAKDSTIVYGDAPAGAGVEYDGLLTDIAQAGITGSVSYTYGYTQCGDVGEYEGAITPGGLASPNYTFVYKPGKLTVTPRPLTLDWSEPSELPYTGMEITYPEPTLGGRVNNDDVRIDEYTGDKETDVGNYTAKVKKIDGTKMGNYILPQDLTHDWNIKGDDNSAVVTLADWVYGDNPNDPVVTADHGDFTAVFTYAADGDDTWSSDVPTKVGTYLVKATIPAGTGYDGAEATASFKITKRPLKVTALPQGVALGESIKTGPDHASADNLADGDSLADVTLTTDPETPTTEATFTGKITPSDAVIKNASDEDMTENYEIEYEDALMVAQPGATIANDKVIWAMHRVIWMSVAEATVLCEAEDFDEQIVQMADAHACFTDKLPSPEPDEELDIHVIDDGGFEPVVGIYQLTLKANPELGVTAHVYDNSSSNPDTGVKVFANDTKPLRSILRAAKGGDRDAIATLIKIAEATAVDTDGNPIDVVDIDLSSVDPENPSTYMAIYLTADGDSVQAHITVPEEDDEPAPGDDDGNKDKPDGDDDGKGDNPDGDKDDSGKIVNKGGKDSDDGEGKDDGKDGNGSGKGNSGKGSNDSSDDEADGDGLAGLPASTGDDAAAHIVALALVAILAAGALLFSRLRRRDEE